MKIAVQNGAAHGLSRRQVEAVVAALPHAWQRSVASITLCEGSDPELHVKHYPKERTVGVFWPAAHHPQPSSETVLEQLFVSLEVIARRGALPKNLSASVRSSAMSSTSSLRSRCIVLLAQDGT